MIEKVLYIISRYEDRKGVISEFVKPDVTRRRINKSTEFDGSRGSNIVISARNHRIAMHDKCDFDASREALAAIVRVRVIHF